MVVPNLTKDADTIEAIVSTTWLTGEGVKLIRSILMVRQQEIYITAIKSRFILSKSEIFTNWKDDKNY